MLKKLLVGILSLGLLVGCGAKEKTVETHKTETKAVTHVQSNEGSTEASSKDEMKDALKVFNQGKVVDVTDARKTTEVITVIIHLDESMGASSQAGAIVSEAQKFVKELKDKPKTVSVVCQYEGAKVLQFHIDVPNGTLVVDQAHPDIIHYLKLTHQIK